VGDDNVALGSSSSASADIVITNCTFGEGHGVSIGSFTSGGVSNLTVINCTFNSTDNGIRIKSDNNRGGIVQNLSYLNIGMTNVDFPITIYSYYNSVGTPGSITPAIAASQTVIPYPTNNPVYRNITFSNIVATAVSGFPAGIIWARPEMPATNITFIRCNLSASESFDVYSARGVRFVDPQINVPSTVTSFLLYNSQVMVTNSAPGGNVTIDGLAANSTVNGLTLVNAQASLKNTNVFDGGPLALSASTLTVSNNLNLSASGEVDFTLGTNAATITVRSNLVLGGTINLTAGPGLTNGLYTLFTYGSGLNWASPAIGITPAGNYTYSFNTNLFGQVRLSVQPAVSLAPISLNFEAMPNQLGLSWPADHIGWHLLIQTNSAGLGTNWQVIAGSELTNQFFLPIDPAQGSVFLRLSYP
jgi:hypothetical protein